MKLNTLVFILITLVVLGGVIWLLTTPSGPGKYDQFATCLADKGAKFYGTWWCPHCKNQKAMFGSSVKYLPYIECAAPGETAGQLQICKDANIQGYPTWVFADGSRETGEVPLEKLAEKTGCVLPVNGPDTTTVTTGSSSAAQ